jgi:hypothetical protein
MAAISFAVGRVPKRGRNEFHKYDFAQESDITEAVKRACYEHNVSLRFAVVKDSVERRTVATSRGGESTETRLWLRMHVVNADEPSEAFAEDFPGEALDAGDKSLWKAITGAKKYAMICAFAVSTGDDPEHVGAGDGPSQQQQQQQQRKPKAPPGPPVIAAPEKVQPMSKAVPGEPISAKQRAFIEKRPLWLSATMSERQMFVSQATNGRVRDLDQTTQDEAERVFHRLENFDPAEERAAKTDDLGDFDSLPKAPPKTESLAKTLQTQAQALKQQPLIPEQAPQPIDDDVLRSLAGNVSMQDMRELAYMAGECGMGEQALRAVVREVTKRDMLTSGTVGKVRAYLEQRREVEEA